VSAFVAEDEEDFVVGNSACVVSKHDPLGAPMPLTYALSPLDFSLAFIRNMRLGGMSVRACDQLLEICHECGVAFESGSYW